jgi:hypothetical protein
MGESGGVRPRQVQVTYRDPDDVEWTCLLRDAALLPFEEHLPIRPVAHRGPDQANTPTTYWSSTTNRMIDAESHLERVWMTLLDFDPTVTAFSAQPMRLSGIDANGRWKATPDLFVRRDDDSATVVEVKNPDKLGDPKVLRTAARVSACCAEIGWSYELVGEPPDRQRTVNVLQLAGFRRPMVGLDAYRDRILEFARRRVTVRKVIGRCDEPAVALAVVQHLLWSGELQADLSRVLDLDSIVRAAT